MRIELIRSYYDDHTISQFELDGVQLYILERPWLDNLPNVSCIPEGMYEVSRVGKERWRKYKDVWEVENVPERSSILIHRGNYVRNSRGCLLIGFKYAPDVPMIQSSVPARNFLRKRVRDFELLITSGADHAYG